jgi:hypothetical protein
MRVKLGTGGLFDHFYGLSLAEGLVVRPVAGQGLVDIGNGDNTGADRDIFSFDAAGITLPIPAFVMIKNERDQGVQKLYGPDYIRPDLRMFFNLLELFFVELAFF